MTTKTTRKKRSWKPARKGRDDQNNPQEKVVATKTTRKKRSWQHVRKGRGDQNNPQEKVVATKTTRKKRSWQHVRKGRDDQNNPQEKVVATLLLLFVWAISIFSSYNSIYSILSYALTTCMVGVIIFLLLIFMPFD